MTPDEHQSEIDLFHEALAQPPGRRAAYIEERHAGDPALIDRLSRLLEAHRRAEEAESATAAITPPQGLLGPDATPEWIGPYRVLEILGEGGMGVVYAAQQMSPIRRRVALKIIKLGMDTKQVIARFEAERQALAMLDHPGVAKVFDAGATEGGRPYFVMELVKGLPLTDYCAKHKCPLRDRLRLFVDLCDAVQHAHQRGIIHRDLKPSNVLVAVAEGRPVPKVIDFGVAKSTSSKLSEQTLFTEQGQLIGTPDYMSPEQAEMSGLGIDTRTDVYSLGVILYELLTGVPPFDPEALRAEGYLGVRRVIREVDPPLPSARLSELRRAEPAAGFPADTSPRQLRGELDWVVARATDKDRTRRYESAAALMRDVKYYLSDLPVQAGPPSLAYKLRKFVKRNRFLTFTFAVTSLALVLGVAGLTIGLVNARRAESLAEQRAEDAKRAEALAERRAENAQAASGFLERLLFQADPELGNRSPTLDEVIESAGASIDEKLGAYPEVEASVRESIGVAYRRRSEFPKAAPHLRKSLEIRRNLLGEESLDTAASYIAMADLRFEYEGDIGDALAMFEKARRAYARHDASGSVGEGWLQLDIGLVNLAADRIAAAERAFAACQKLLAKHQGPAHPDVSRPIRGLAMVALARHDPAAAERLAREAVALCDGEGVEYLGARARLVLARVLLETGQINQVNQLLTTAREQLYRTVGDRHIRITEHDACVCELLLRQGSYALAERAAQRCEALRRKLLDARHWSILEARMLRARARAGLGDAEAGEAELFAIAQAASRLLGPDHPLSIRVASARVDCSRALGDDQLAAVRAERVTQLKTRRAARIRAGRAPE